MFVCPTCGHSGASPGFCTEDGTALADGSADPLLGQTVGPYRLARLLGRGGMGAVYLGIHPGIGSRVAVKVLTPAASESPALVDRFFSEARTVNVIRHESIVNVLDLSHLPDGRPYIVMECLEGASLSQHFASLKPFPLDVLARMGIGVAGALGAAHAAEIIHRDLKPDNIFLTNLGLAKVLDFGIAKLRPEEGSHTSTGALLGTPSYMSPEQAQGQPVDPRSDLYSLGVILFEGATGRVPFEGQALYEVLHQHVNVPPPPPRAARPDLPPQFEAIILCALAKRREDRFQSAAELADALARVLPELPQSRSLPAPPLVSGVPTPVRPTPSAGASWTAPTFAATSSSVSPSQAPAPARSSPVLLLFGAAAALLALLALVVGVFVLGWSARGDTTPTVSGTGGPASPSAGTSKEGRFDAVAFLPEATKRARTHFPDAELYNFVIAFPDRNGSIVFDDIMKSVGYSFRSPAASRGTGKRKCLVWVAVSKNGKFDSVTESEDCNQPTSRGPRCSLANVAGKVPGDSPIAAMSYYSGPGGVFQWVVSQRNNQMSIVPDDC